MAMPNFMSVIVTQTKKRPDVSGRFERSAALYQLGDAAGEPDGELPPPPLLGDAAGDVTTGVLGWVLGGAPNQFQRAKPKNSRINTMSAMSAAAMPAPAPVVSPLVSTTSVPAGLQYLRTL
jgi:hypothetical protein